MSDVSIVLATYNGGRFLREQLESILSNTYQFWNVEICDDGSTDNTIEIAEEYVKKYPNKITLHKNHENLGITMNFLEGAKRAKGNYIMFCDQDDVWLPHKIERTLNRMQEEEQRAGRDVPIAVFTDAKVVDIRLRKMYDSFYKTGALDTKKLDLPHLLIENKVIGCTTMFNRALLQQLKELPEFARYHDWWIALVAAVFGKLCFLDEVTIQYRQHGGNMVGSQSFFKYAIERTKYIKVQKASLRTTEKQAWNFYEIYKNQMLEEQKQVIYDFAYLNNMNWLERRDKVIHYGFWKTGLLRNIGVLLLI